MTGLLKTELLLLMPVLFFFACGIERSHKRLSSLKITKTAEFPKDFLWGTATAAEQIESTPDSNWYAFEKEVLKNKNFGTISPGQAKPGHIHNLGNYSLDQILKRTNHEEMFESDFAMAEKMKHNSYRFSIAWDKLYPREGMNTPDPNGIRYYKNLIASMKKHGLKPSATLFHFSTPAWFWNAKNGKRGWEREDSVSLFGEFVKSVVENFGKDVTHWCTLNEPMVLIFAGYMEGVHPPNETRKDVKDVIPVMSALLKAHSVAYKIIKEQNAKDGVHSEIGYTMHTRAFEAYRNYAILDRIVAEKIEQAFIWDFVDATVSGTLKVTNTNYVENIPGLKGTLDYLGINYYGRHYIKTNIFSPTNFKVLMSDSEYKDEVVNDLSWAHYPIGFYNIMKKSFEKYKLPIYVLENGTADKEDDDKRRQGFLVTHAYEMSRAISDKIPVKGYFHWSLIDNFEWAEGYEAKFGLVKTDYQNKYNRIPRGSASVYTEIIEKGVSPEIFEKYSGAYK